MVAPARWSGASRRAIARSGPDEPGRVVAGEAAGTVERVVGSARGGEPADPVGTGEQQDGDVGAEEFARLADDHGEDLVEVGQGGDRDADPVQRPCRRLAPLEVGIAGAQLRRQRGRSDRRRSRVKTQARTPRPTDHDDRVEREREHLVEQAVADQLDDGHGDDRCHDAEPAQGSHPATMGRGRPVGPCRATRTRRPNGPPDPGRLRPRSATRRGPAARRASGYPSRDPCVPADLPPGPRPQQPQSRWCP